MKKSYFVRAVWDAKAKVFYSESDVPGLVLETKTLEEFEAAMVHFVPQLIAENVLGLEPDAIDIPSLPPVEYTRPLFAPSDA